MADDDIVQIGTSDFGKSVIALLTEERIGGRLNHHRMFKLDRSAYKFAVAVAIAKDLEPLEDARFSTSQAVDAADRDGRLRALVEYHYPTRKDPYRLSQGLAEAGFHYIKSQIDNLRTFADISGLL